jgi:hypothetical protein
MAAILVCTASRTEDCEEAMLNAVSATLLASEAKLFAVLAISFAFEAMEFAWLAISFLLEARSFAAEATLMAELCATFPSLLASTVALYERGAHMPKTMVAATVSTRQVHRRAKTSGLSFSLRPLECELLVATGRRFSWNCGGFAGTYWIEEKFLSPITNLVGPH